MSVIAAKLVAVFIACGSYAAPGTVGPGPYVCVANVYPPITMTTDECLESVNVEAMRAEVDMIRGGFNHTKNESGCFDVGHGFTRDDTLNAYMRGTLRAEASKVQRFKFEGGRFEIIQPIRRIPGQRM